MKLIKHIVWKLEILLDGNVTVYVYWWTLWRHKIYVQEMSARMRDVNFEMDPLFRVSNR